jgi:hypothetical protein
MVPRELGGKAAEKALLAAPLAALPIPLTAAA